MRRTFSLAPPTPVPSLHAFPIPANCPLPFFDEFFFFFPASPSSTEVSLFIPNGELSGAEKEESSRAAGPGGKVVEEDEDESSFTTVIEGLSVISCC